MREMSVQKEKPIALLDPRHVEESSSSVWWPRRSCDFPAWSDLSSSVDWN